jgi:hypothetical protein
MDSAFSGHIGDRFAEGFWTIVLSMHDHDIAGARFLCHARNDREARRIADRLKDQTRGVMGYHYDRLADPVGLSAKGTTVKLGEYCEIVNDADWADLERFRISAK